MVDIILVSAFVLVMLSWNVCLMRQNNDLMNKLMSRDFSEYASTERYLKTKPPAPKNEDSEMMVPDPYDTQRARDLNGIMGLG